MTWSAGSCRPAAVRGFQIIVSAAEPEPVRIGEDEIQADVRELLLPASTNVGYSSSGGER